ncbi:MAG: hypothetical protein AAB475_00890 [Patescibacteria group bacterium]
MEKHPIHLKNPELQASPEVERAVLHQEAETGGKLPNKPSKRIKIYLNRLEKLILDPQEEV